LYARLDRLDDAERALRKAIAEVQQNESLKTALVEFLWARRGHDAAATELKRMIAAAPTQYELRFTLAKFDLENNDPAGAESVYQEVIQKDGAGAYGVRARDGLAVLYASRNDSAHAEKLVDEVLETNPAQHDARMLCASR